MYAYSGSSSDCFLNTQPGFSSWGWSFQPGQLPATFDLYAGASQCNISTAVKVGELQVAASGVTYVLLPGVNMIVASLHVGSSRYPTDGSGSPTTNPEVYRYQQTFPATGASSYTFSVPVNSSIR